MLGQWVVVSVFSVLSVLMTGCISVKTEPIRVEPIQITMDINLRIARELDDFFGDLDEEAELLDYDEPIDSSTIKC
ncbi:MAG TPA: hypothetical protein EYG38_00510 [Verrucomicrobia bacterium]|nr:hypothetical protein [Verrucomicrobiota bacterium]